MHIRVCLAPGVDLEPDIPELERVALRLNAQKTHFRIRLLHFRLQYAQGRLRVEGSIQNGLL